MPVILQTKSSLPFHTLPFFLSAEMMLGERHHHPNPTVHVPPWALLDETNSDFFSSSPPLTRHSHSVAISNASAASDYSPYHLQEALTALQRYLPSNDVDFDSDSDFDHPDSPVDAYTCDHFRMFEFKVRRCVRGRSHDWTECPYTHPGEKARRRDPRKYHYSGTSCPDFRKGSCKKGDACEYAHGVFECWLHPARYRTQPCKDGTNCRRRVCFFAHTSEQLRVLPQQSPRSVNSAESYDGSPLRQAIEVSCGKTLSFLSSPLSISPPATPPTGESPPMSPMAMTQSLSPSLGSNSINEMVASLRNLQLGKVNSLPSSRGSGLGTHSPRGSTLRPGFCSLPTTPTRGPTRPAFGYPDSWETVTEEPTMERVESGRDLRVRMFERLSRENNLDRVDPDPCPFTAAPDVGWISDLVG